MQPDTHSRLDHLVVVAQSLEQGVQWCEAMLGVTPRAGGEHPFMGTHNRLLPIGSPAWPQVYLEIIAIHSFVTRPLNVPAHRQRLRKKRWFDMDDRALQQCVYEHGPQLAAWVLRVPHIAPAAARLAALELDPGEICEVQRATPRGELRCLITLRDDGRRQLGAVLPTLVEWPLNATGQMPHPMDELTPPIAAATTPQDTVALHTFSLTHPQPALVQAAFGALGLRNGPAIGAGPAALHALLHTPRGLVVLRSPAPPA